MRVRLLLGAWLSHFRGPGNPNLPASVYAGNASRHPGAGFFPPEHAPLFVNNPSNGLANLRRPDGVSATVQDRRTRLAGELDAEFVQAFGKQRAVATHASAYEGAYRMMACRDVAAFDLQQEQPATREAYGADPFGQGCLLVRRLVERRVRFVEVSLHGWDTHSGNFTGTPDLCDKLDRGLAALIADLHARGMLRDTLVVVTTEFGRSPTINATLGRDHYPKAFSAALFGGGVKGGFVEVVARKATIPDFNATLGHALGLPIDQVVTSPEQRPFKLADRGRPLTTVFA